MPRRSRETQNVIATLDGWKLREARRQYRAFVSARLILVGLFIGLWFVLFDIGYPMPLGFLITLVAECAALFAFLWLSVYPATPQGLHRVHLGLLGVELVCHSVMFYFLGGISWLGAIAYIYALMYASVFLPRWQAAVFTAIVACAYLTVVLLDAAGVVPHQWYLPQGPERFRDPEFVLTTSLAFVGVLWTVTFWMVFIGGELRRERDAALRANADLVRAQRELEKLNEELEIKVRERTRALAWRAEHDELTGLYNRGAVTRRGNELLRLARRGGRPLVLIMADGDRFKQCNDTGGHPFGDRVLQVLAEHLRACSRASDVLGRTGGDEFLVILPDTGCRGALRYCARVRRRIRAWRAEMERKGRAVPTLSMGLAVFPEHGADLEELLRVADRAMYEAKALGGDRVVVAAYGEKAVEEAAAGAG